MKPNDSKYNAAREQVVGLQQALALLRQQNIELNEQGQIVIAKGTEQEKIVKLTTEELKNYQAQMAILNRQHTQKMNRAQAPKPTFFSTMFENFKRQLTYMTTQSLVYKVIGYIT
jgi:nitrate reductase NapAB chaperone NapD